MSANTKFAKQSILGKPPSSSRPKPYAVPTLPNSTAFPKVGETNALSNPVTSNSVPSSRESTVVNNERVIAPGIFRINPVKANRVDNFVPNKHVKTSVRTKPIIVSQPHDDCVRQYVNGMKSRKKNQSANVSKSANQKKHKAQNTMAEQNVPAQPPTRTNEQIVPRSQWLTIEKSNLLFNAQKIQKNPIFQILVDILSNTNFFQAFTASANVPAIYLQQFWKIMSYNAKIRVYSCQVDEQWFDLSADLLRKALAITPVNPAHPFELPLFGDTVIDFVNGLGYPEPVEIVSSIRTNYVYQPWRAILSLLNQCLTGKTSGSDKPRHPVLQMLWGIVTQTNVDHAELIWEEFTQGIQTFFSHKAPV
ncbi:hypothetical protein Tco_0905356 [Tanacetum coccineum]